MGSTFRFLAERSVRRTFLPGALLLAACLAAPAYAQNPAIGGRNDRPTVPTCPTGSVLINGSCARPTVPQACPPGTVGSYPTCRPAVRSACPSGTQGVYPNCRPTLNLPPPLDEQYRMQRQ